MTGGKGATGAEAKNLERGPKAPEPGSEAANMDHHLRQFVPDASVVGASMSKEKIVGS